jgi:hypothetical protein
MNKLFLILLLCFGASAHAQSTTTLHAPCSFIGVTDNVCAYTQWLQSQGVSPYEAYDRAQVLRRANALPTSEEIRLLQLLETSKSFRTQALLHLLAQDKDGVLSGILPNLTERESVMLMMSK